MDDKPEDLLRELGQIYCPPIDPALFFAITSDFDLKDVSQAQSCRSALDILKLSALEQEHLPFDPSGTSDLDVNNGFDADGIVSEFNASQNGTVRSHETDMTSLTSELSAASVESNSTRSHTKQQGPCEHIGYIVGVDGSIVLSGATKEDKIGYLVEMFPSADLFSIQHTLAKTGGDVDRSMDILLNLAFFGEQIADEDGMTVYVPKGVDGFAEDPNDDIGRRKGRRRKTKSKSSVHKGIPPNSLLDDDLVVNKWDAGKKDIEFICSRTSAVLRREMVASVYYSNGACLSATIRSLAATHAKEGQSTSENSVIAAQLAELNQIFPSMSSTLFAGLLWMTRNSVSAASELAEVVVNYHTPSLAYQLVKITPARPPISTEASEPVRRPVIHTTPDYSRARISAGAYYAAGAEAFSKASAAYRRSKSDRMMGGAAAYYSAVGRDHLRRAKRDSSAAADALVDSQSTSAELDLHGVCVQDAVRISREKVWEWWESLGDAKYMQGAKPPLKYRIVTGVGRHSHDGTSRLGPAVGKMLAREGWKVEIGQGVLTVIGTAQHIR